MPKYMCLTPIFMQPTNEAGPRTVAIGEVVSFDEAPGAALAPMDVEAAKNHEYALGLRDAQGRAHDILQAKRYLGGLNGAQRKMIEAAELAMRAPAS
jgi:hypothetical protein